MIVLVTGGAGFIGRRIVRLLADRGQDVVSLDLNAAPLPDEFKGRVRAQRLDVTSFEDVIAAFAIYKPDVVINLAYTLSMFSDPRFAMKLNILGMDNCFEAARLCDVKRVIFASSMGVSVGPENYGDAPIRETDPLVLPDAQYSMHKIFNEWQAKDYRDTHGMNIVGVRVMMVTGADKVLGSLDHVHCIRGAALGQKVSFPYRDAMKCIIYVDDVAEIFTRMAMAQTLRHNLYNTGGETISLGEIADIVNKFIPDADIAFEHETGDKPFLAYSFNNDRLTEELDIRFAPYEQRVGEMIAVIRREVMNAGRGR